MIRRAALVVMLLAATALRVWNVSSSPPTFHPTRQYAGLALAKAWYDDLSGDLPADQRAAVEANGRTAPRLEPRVLEAVVAASYVLLGGEQVWVGGLLSSLLWAAGGVCLYLLARRLASDLAAWVSVAFYLFVPFGILASRTFQPDPAMVAFLLAAVLALVRHAEAPTTRRLVAAAVLAGVAVLLKPVCVFVLAGAYVAIATGRSASWKALLSRTTLLLGVIAALPAAVFYIFESATQTAVGSFADSGFLPRLWLEGFYWRGWLRLVNSSVGLAMLALALVSPAVARHRDARRLMAGMFAGYVVYGLVFNYHIHTHSYYQLQLIPIVGLGLGLTADAASARVRAIDLSRLWRPALAGALGVLALALVVTDIRLARAGTGPAARRELAQAPAIGDVVGHSTNTVALAPAYGLILFHQGNLSGSAWPNQGDLRFRALQGQKRRTVAEELAGVHADWFIVTDFRELAAQPGLRALLDRRGRLVAEEPGYLVYDLREPPAPG